MANKIAPEIEEEIKKRLKGGGDARVIARQLNISVNPVLRLLREGAEVNSRPPETCSFTARQIAEVVYLTGMRKRPLPTHVQIRSARIPSVALCEQVDTVSHDRIGRQMGHISTDEQKAVDRALKVSLGLEAVE